MTEKGQRFRSLLSPRLAEASLFTKEKDGAKLLRPPYLIDRFLGSGDGRFRPKKFVHAPRLGIRSQQIVQRGVIRAEIFPS